MLYSLYNTNDIRICKVAHVMVKGPLKARVIIPKEIWARMVAIILLV